MVINDADKAIANLEKALATGYTTIKYDGVEKTYSSTDEILKGIQYFEKLKSKAKGGRRPASTQITMTR